VKQLLFDPKAGGAVVADVPEPQLLPGCILVRTARSVVSPGTERNATAAGVMGLARSVRDRPDLAGRAIDSMRRDGVRATLAKVRARLDDSRALGSSSSGIVLGVADDASARVRVGQRVACTGSGAAVHAEIACVPSNLVVPVPEGVSLEQAAFGTLGAIAVHAVRQARPEIGERFAVIGLGLVGQLVAQVLRASGARVAAYDLSADRVERARRLGAEIGLAGGGDEIAASALAWTDDVGVDGVLVCAQSSDDSPMVAAARACRDRARVVAVGLVPFALPREIAYDKELDLRISRSTGPGRYEPLYEEHGIDYPIGHVRWTEARNVEAFLHLVGERRVDVDALIDRRLPLARAASAYGEDGSVAIGTVIEYPELEEAGSAPGGTVPMLRRRAKATGTVPARGAASAVGKIPGRVGVAVIGAGAFARSTLLPALKAAGDVALERAIAATGPSAQQAQRAFGFAHAGTDVEEALADPRVHAVVIATRHDSHGELVVRALQAGKHVFVEKPLALDDEEIDAVERAALASGATLVVGFNRRFAPMAVEARRRLEGRGPVAMSLRVRAPPLPHDHWLLDPLVGGGRLVGEGCHFVDLASFLAGDPGIEAARATSIGGSGVDAPGFAAQVRYADGSVAQLLYATRADTRAAKEAHEAHAGGLTVTIDDFARGQASGDGSRKASLGSAGKGHAEELRAWIAGVRAGRAPVPLDVTLRVARTTLLLRRALSG
jgi:predicted dehydrogenase